MKQVVVVHAPADAARAGEVAGAMEALGYGVTVFACNGPEGRARRDRGAAIRDAKCALVLWSRSATLSLRHAANDARRAGNLALARIDTASAPALLGLNAVTLKPGRYQSQAVRQLVERSMSLDEARPSGRTTRYAAILTALAMTFVTAAAAYVVAPSFATRVNAVVASAQALVGGHN
jgi:hypothetical protein